MSRERDPRQVLHEAKVIARDHGMFVVEKSSPKGTRYILYREQAPYNVCVGTRGTPDAIRALVCKAANFH